MIYLQSKREYSKIIEYDPVQDKMREMIKNNDIVNEYNINGVYDKLNSSLVALYMIDTKMILRIEDKCYTLSDRLSLSLKKIRSNRIIVVKLDGHVVQELAYTVTKSDKIKNDTTAFIEDEDYDFGAFLFNIMSNSLRRRVLEKSWGRESRLEGSSLNS